MSGRVVQWSCDRPEHLARSSRHGLGGLTIYEGAWAYCDGAGSEDGHRWVATGGVALEAVVRWAGATSHVNGSPTNGTTPTNGSLPTNGSTPTGKPAVKSEPVPRGR